MDPRVEEGEAEAEPLVRAGAQEGEVKMRRPVTGEMTSGERIIEMLAIHLSVEVPGLSGEPLLGGTS